MIEQEKRKTESRIEIQDGVSFKIFKRRAILGIEMFTISTEDGKSYLKAQFLPDEKKFVIDNFKTNQGRVGMGKRLLRLALSEAQRTKAAKITATLISREALADVQEVFGEDFVNVVSLGEYGKRGTTAAFLNFPLVNHAPAKFGKGSGARAVEVKGDLL